jgi:hypothetical protein
VADIKKQFLLPNRKIRCRKPDGTETHIEATPEMIDKVIATGNDLIAAGYDVPLPYEHDLDIVLSIPTSRKKGLWDDPLRNSGFVKKFFKDEEGGASFVAPESTADGKLGEKIKHVSVYLRQKFIDTDVDRNKTWEYAPMHIALTNKPSMTGLKGFEKVTDGMLLSMDDMFSEDTSNTSETDDNGQAPENDIKELAKSLKARFGIKIPENTRLTELARFLLLATDNAPEMVPASSLQKEGSEETLEEVDPEEKKKVDEEVENIPDKAKPAKGSPTDSGVWAMSIEELQAELKKKDEQIAVLLSQKNETAVKTFRERTDALKKRGMSADTLARRVEPVLSKKNDKGEAVLLSQADEQLLDAVLSSLEESLPTHSHSEVEDDALLSQTYVPDVTDPNIDEEDACWAAIKKANNN